MEISEQNKQEADKVITTINAILIYNEGVIVTKHFVIECAIQDRLSVLDLAKVAVQTCTDETTNWWEKEITNLTEQIEYLKSKL